MNSNVVQSLTREMQIARSHLFRAAECASNEGNEALVGDLVAQIELLNALIAKSATKQVLLSIPDAP